MSTMSYTNEIIQIDEGLYCIKDVKSINKYLILGEEKAMLLDTGYGFADPRPVIRSITDLPLVVADTHGDIDHAAGNYWFDEVYLSLYDYRNLGHIEHPALRRQQMEYRLNKPGSTLGQEMELEEWMRHGAYECRYCLIDDGFSFELGDRKLEVLSVPGHTAGSLAFLDHKTGYLFTGDSVMKYNVFFAPVCSPKAPYELLRDNEPLLVYENSLRKLQKRKAEMSLLFPGHGEMGISPEFIDDLLVNLQEIRTQTGKHERFTTYRGSQAIRHAYKETLIYYTDEKLWEYQRVRRNPE